MPEIVMKIGELFFFIEQCLYELFSDLCLLSGSVANESASKASSQPGRCSRICHEIIHSRVVSLFRVREHPLDDTATLAQKAAWSFRCPPHGKVGWVLTRYRMTLFFLTLDFCLFFNRNPNWGFLIYLAFYSYRN